ncbi:MAG: penicillin-binding transpeptidase domain-containing protein, partial [Actinomycetes bacterium]
MIRQINRVTAVIIFLLLSLIVNVSYIQVFQAHDLRKQAGNQRVILTEYSRERGPILLGSKAVAQSTPTSDSLKYLREYAAGPTYAAISGFYSLVYGATGIEREENDVLAGNDSRFFVDRMQQLLAGRKPKGGAIRLTIDPDAQAAAVKALNGRTGAVVAIDPKTGAILALASSPSFDPNLLSSHNAADIQKNYEALNTDPNQPLLNRPLAMTLPPGSTFKLVTAAAALESGKYTAASVLPGPAELALPGTDKKLGNWTG